MTEFTFTNSFHNTAVTLRLDQLWNAHTYFVSDAQAEKARKALCGITGCTCGGNLGERPGLDLVPIDEGFVFYLTD